MQKISACFSVYRHFILVSKAIEFPGRQRCGARRMGLVVRYVNLMFDRGFKRIFGQEANKDILAAFLQEILPELDGCCTTGRI